MAGTARVPRLPAVGRPAGLTGRESERAELGRLVADVAAGHSRALVVRGEQGIGKTALLDWVAASAGAQRVQRITGVQSELELAFAGLHQLCSPWLPHLGRAPDPQREALLTALGLRTGPAPDRFLVGLAVLSLLCDVAGEEPLLCLVDDAQWLDQASAQALAFVARRIDAEAVGLVFAASTATSELAGLPTLAIGGLRDADARQLLEASLTGPVDPQVRDQIIAEARGNPLALLELSREMTAAQLAGGFGLPGPAAGAPGLEGRFRRRIEALPDQSRSLLRIAAADPTGDAALVWRAAAAAGISADAAAPAVEAGLIEFGARLRFRHPLIRSAAYRSGSAAETRQAHRALADVTDPSLDPDRRAWHRAQAAAGPDASVADELEKSAGRAQARGGVIAAAGFLERAAILTLEPAERARRALAAADAKLQAGELDAARSMLALARAGPASDRREARADLVTARIAFAENRGNDAPPLLLAAARRLEREDVELARATYLDALSAGIFAGQLAGPGSSLWELARAAAAAPSPARPARAPDLLLDGLAAYYTDGYQAGLPILHEAVSAFGSQMPVADELRWLWLACITAVHTWDDGGWERLSARYLELACRAGALGELPLALSMRASRVLLTGRLAESQALVAEAQTATEAIAGTLTPYAGLQLAALRGDETTVSALADAVLRDAAGRGEGAGMAAAGMANALLYLGLGRYQEALTAAQLATASPGNIATPPWAIAELIEAAVRAGKRDLAADAYERLAEMTDASGTDWALGHQARAHAQLSTGPEAEERYREAISRLQRTELRICLSRAHLLYGEWLRRERRRVDAREQLRAAFTMLDSMGVAAFAERASRELQATGETVRKRIAPARNDELTAQESQIARLAAQGLSNSEIGTRLYISGHTVQYHLRKVFAKLGVTARSQLGPVLADRPAGPVAKKSR